MSRFWNFLQSHADGLMVIVTVLGFILTICQLREASTALKAGNSYEVQKDAREFLSEILKDTAFRDVLASKAPHDAHSLENLWLMLNFWRSIHRQETAGGLLDEYVNSVHDDFCDFMKRQAVEEGWNKLLADKRIGEGHVQMRKAWCSSS